MHANVHCGGDGKKVRPGEIAGLLNILSLHAGRHGDGDGGDVRPGGQGPQREAGEERVHQGDYYILTEFKIFYGKPVTGCASRSTVDNLSKICTSALIKKEKKIFLI